MLFQASALELRRLTRIPDAVFRACYGFVNWSLAGKVARFNANNTRVLWVFKIQHYIRTPAGLTSIFTEIIYDPNTRRVVA